MLAEELEAAVLDLRDREQIRACILMNARGLDRLDRALWLHSYHDDAVDIRDGFRSNPGEVAERHWSKSHDGEVSQHFISNQLVEIKGDVARAETYFFAIVRTEGKSSFVASAGRYLDILTRKNGEWRISQRTLIRESRMSIEAEGAQAEQTPSSKRSMKDLSYEILQANRRTGSRA